MGKCLIRIRDKYFEWSTTTDRPTTYSMTAKELRHYIKNEYGNSGLRDLPDRLEKIEKYGCSMFGWTIEELLRGNRAGDNDKKLDIDEIYDKYAESKYLKLLKK